jgi:hypothetical protein
MCGTVFNLIPCRLLKCGRDKEIDTDHAFTPWDGVAQNVIDAHSLTLVGLIAY